MEMTLEQYLALEAVGLRERYSNGECWKLAYAVNELCGWPIMAVAEQNDIGLGWVHVLNQRPDGMFVDILGEHDLVDVWDDWGDLLLASDCFLRDVIHIHRADFHERLREDPTEIESDTYASAELLIKFFTKED